MHPALFSSEWWQNDPAGRDVLWTLITVGGILAVTLFVLLSVAMLVYGDRKIWASVQLRKGPNVVGPFGLFQSFADLIKFVLKEPIIPAGANKGVFLLAPRQVPDRRDRRAR